MPDIKRAASLSAVTLLAVGAVAMATPAYAADLVQVTVCSNIDKQQAARVDGAGRNGTPLKAALLLGREGCAATQEYFVTGRSVVVRWGDTAGSLTHSKAVSIPKNAGGVGVVIG